MASDPAIRQAVLQRITELGGRVSGQSYGSVARQLCPPGVTVSQAHQALNSLAYSVRQPRLISIKRKPLGRTTRGDVIVQLR